MVITPQPYQAQPNIAFDELPPEMHGEILARSALDDRLRLALTSKAMLRQVTHQQLELAKPMAAPLHRGESGPDLHLGWRPWMTEATKISITKQTAVQTVVELALPCACHLQC